VRSFRKPFSRLRLPDGGGWVPHSTGHGTGAAVDGGGCRASVYDPVRHRTAFYSFHEAEGIDIHHVERDEVRGRTLTLITRNRLSGSPTPPQPVQPQRQPTVKPHTASVQPQPSRNHPPPIRHRPIPHTSQTHATPAPAAHLYNTSPKFTTSSQEGSFTRWMDTNEICPF